MKNEGGGKLASVRRWFRIMAIDVCLLFNVSVVFSSKYFRFLFVKAIGMKIGEAHRNVRSDSFKQIGAPILLADYKEDDCVRCASPIFIPIAY
jgi:hypothetical protein